MCFRPTGVSAQVECPNCGKKVNPVMGNIPKLCPFCDTPMPQDGGAGVGPSGGPAPAAPAAPGAPAAPSAPGAMPPTAPGAPQNQ